MGDSAYVNQDIVSHHLHYNYHMCPYAGLSVNQACTICIIVQVIIIISPHSLTVNVYFVSMENFIVTIPQLGKMLPMVCKVTKNMCQKLKQQLCSMFG